jgi:hypothetical protein
MTYRERRERKAERLRGWAEKRKAKSGAAFKGAHDAIDGIPPGQPILVGHHSEKRHRGALERHDQRMRAGFEHQEKARSMESRAAEIDRQAENAIYSDDDDAIERLEERIAELEQQRERIKVSSKAIRKYGLEALMQPAPPFELTQKEKRDALSLMSCTPYHKVESRGWPSYYLQNLGGNITRNRKRLEQLKAREAQRARVRAAQLEEHRAADPHCTCPDCIVAHFEPEPATPAELAAEIAQAEATAAPLADVPFSLTAPFSVRKARQRGLL